MRRSHLAWGLFLPVIGAGIAVANVDEGMRNALALRRDGVLDHLLHGTIAPSQKRGYGEP